MRTSLLSLRHPSCFIQEGKGNLHHYLSAYPEFRCHKHVNGMAYHTFGCVFYRHHTIINPPPLHIIKYIHNILLRYALRREAKILLSGLMGECGLWPEIGAL